MKKKINNEDIIIASHNEGKVSEIKDLLQNYDLKILSSNDLGIDELTRNVFIGFGLCDFLDQFWSF